MSSFVILKFPTNYTYPRRGESIIPFDPIEEVSTVEDLDLLLEKYPESLWSSRDDMTKTYIGARPIKKLVVFTSGLSDTKNR